jgi:hypothetical protein
MTSSPPPAVRRACTLILWSTALALVSLLPGIAPDIPEDQDASVFAALGIFAFFAGLTLWR